MTRIMKTQSSLVRRSETPEDALWRNVIMQALQDATRNISGRVEGQFKKQMAALQQQARDWFALQSEDFHDVCSMAGLDASNVHAFAMAQIRKTIDEAHEATVTENFLKGSGPGVVAEITDGFGYRPKPTAQKIDEIEFSQNREFAKCR